jgi:hypothetical protein
MQLVQDELLFRALLQHTEAEKVFFVSRTHSRGYGLLHELVLNCLSKLFPAKKKSASESARMDRP